MSTFLFGFRCKRWWNRVFLSFNLKCRFSVGRRFVHLDDHVLFAIFTKIYNSFLSASFDCLSIVLVVHRCEWNICVLSYLSPSTCIHPSMRIVTDRVSLLLIMNTTATAYLFYLLVFVFFSSANNTRIRVQTSPSAQENMIIYWLG